MIAVNINIDKKIEDFYGKFFSRAAKDGKEKPLEYCIKKAWADATQRERFNGQNSDIIKNKENIQKFLKERIEDIIKGNRKIESSSDYNDWHKEIYSRSGYGEEYKMSYGIWQKFVNMTFKYMYCFYKFQSRFSELNSVFKYCHCPIDSVIAQRAVTLCIVCKLDPPREIVEIARSGKPNWNSMEEDDYNTVRKNIQDLKNEFTINNSDTVHPTELEFDFLFW